MAAKARHWYLRVALVFTLAAQLASGSLAWAGEPAATPGAQLAAAMVLCLGGSHHGQAPVHHHLPEMTIASASHHVVQHLALPDLAWTVIPPRSLLTLRTGLPEARGPPAREIAAFYPTGPPNALI